MPWPGLAAAAAAAAVVVVPRVPPAALWNVWSGCARIRIG